MDKNTIEYWIAEYQDNLPYIPYSIQLERKRKFEIWKNAKIENPRCTFLHLCNQVFFKMQNSAHIFVCNQEMSISDF